MLYPVRGSTRLAGPFSPASVIANQGPGNLYLYRNSAASIAAYDAVVGPGGNAQWPGGELWAATDQQGTVANVLNAGAVIDSGSVAVTGSVAIQGTVDTGGGGGSTPAVPAYQGARDVPSLSGEPTRNIQTPAATTSASTLVILVMTPANASVPGFTQQYANRNVFSNIAFTVWTKLATSADANGGASYAINQPGGNQLTATMLAFSGLNKLIATVNYQNTTLSTDNIQTPTVNNTQALIAVTQSTQFGGTTGPWSWAPPPGSGGGPPSPQPAITDRTSPTDVNFRQRMGITMPTWTAGAAYQMLNSPGADGNNPASLYTVAIG